MSCTDCYNNCAGKIITDKCVKYTGPDIEFLGIESGQPLSQIEAAIFEQLEETLNGSGITLEDLSLCTSIEQALGNLDHTLVNIIQALSTVICSLRTDVTTLQNSITAPLSILAPCLTLPSSPTRDQILQAIATKLCSIDTSVNTILATNYVTASQVCTLVEECIGDSTAAGQEYSKMPKYVALPYHGPLSVFDSQGRGLSSAGYDKVYICNGQTVGTFVTPDYRGRSPIGVNMSIPGGAMDSSVDPSVPANAGYGIAVNTKKGNYTHTLSLTEGPSHSHTVNDPGHTHSYIKPSIQGHPGGSSQTEYRRGDPAPTGSSTTGITIGNSGGGQAHNNTHPVIGGVFIMYIP